MNEHFDQVRMLCTFKCLNVKLGSARYFERRLNKAGLFSLFVTLAGNWVVIYLYFFFFHFRLWLHEIRMGGIGAVDTAAFL